MTGAIALARASQARKSTGGLHGRALTWALLVHAGLFFFNEFTTSRAGGY